MRRPRSQGATWGNDLIAALFDQNGLQGYRREVAVRSWGRGTYHIDFSFNGPVKTKSPHSVQALIGSGRAVAVEFEGGVFVRGGGYHQRGKRYASDCRKYRKLALDGWCVLRYTAEDFQSPALVVEEIKQALGLSNDFERLIKTGM